MATIKLEIPNDDPIALAAMSGALAAIAAAHGYDFGSAPEKPDAPTDKDDSKTVAAKPTPSLFDKSDEELGKSAVLSAGTAEDAGEAGTGQPTTPPGATLVGAPVDEKGVPRNDEYVGTAAEPFYTTGKTAGQWKKKKGVDQSAYDAWYASELAKLQGAPSDSDSQQQEDGPANVAAAFGNNQQQVPQNTAPPVPTTAGEFMKWVGEKITAQAFTQADVDRAYADAGVTIADLFNPDTAAVYGCVQSVYGRLAGWFGA